MDLAVIVVPAEHVLAVAEASGRADRISIHHATDERVPALVDSIRGSLPEGAELLRPHPLPADLAAGLGAAQLWAGVAELRRRLASGAAEAEVAAVEASA